MANLHLLCPMLIFVRHILAVTWLASPRCHALITHGLPFLCHPCALSQTCFAPHLLGKSVVQISGQAAISARPSAGFWGLQKPEGLGRGAGRDVPPPGGSHVGLVKHAAKVALEEHQHQFRHRRWNCSTLQGLPVFGKVILQGTRESAFVHAVSSAGLAFAMTWACSRGELEKCGCDLKIRGVSPEGFQWSGCSDNLSYGIAFSQAFVDTPERSRGASSSRGLMNLHNNEAGRKAVVSHMKVECKCHGVSGSCEVRTCWKVMPPFRKVGNILREKFEGATEVHPKRVGSRKLLVPKNSHLKPYAIHDLVYLAASPDFCNWDPHEGIFGTSGRHCNWTSPALDGCELLCCGRGFRTAQAEVVERCSCKFRWCCAVECRQCRNLVEVHLCQ